LDVYVFHIEVVWSFWHTLELVFELVLFFVGELPPDLLESSSSFALNFLGQRTFEFPVQK